MKITMSDDTTATPPASFARVLSERPGRYAKQLCAHMGRKIDASWDEDSRSGLLVFSREGVESGRCRLSAVEGALLLALDAADEELERLEHVVGVHLARFGAKDALAVEWSRSDGSAGLSLGPFTPEEVAEHRRAKKEARQALSARGIL